MNPHELEPSVPWPPDSTFARRLEEHRGAKRHVAVKVAERFLPPGVSAFIADGSSTFWVGRAVFQQALEAHRAGHGRRTHLFTVNLGLQDEYAFGPDLSGFIRLTGGDGETHRDLFTVWGHDTEEFVAKAIVNSRVAILAVNGLSNYLGPFGVDEETNPIKRTAIKAIGADQQLVFVTDHKKLAVLPSTQEPRPFPVVAASEWKKLRNQPNIYVVTTRYPGAPPLPMRRLPENARESDLDGLEPAERYTFQAHYLRQSMGDDRFIECPVCECFAE